MVKNKICAIVNLTEDETALKPLTSGRPIAALPFASRYRVLDFYLSSIAHAEIDSCALFISESGRSIYDHIRSGEAWNFDSRISGGIFTFSQQNWKLRHLKEHQSTHFYEDHKIFMRRSNAEYVFVSGSKIIANVDIRAFRKHHIESGSDISVIYKPITLVKQRENSDDRHLLLDANGQVTGVAPIRDANEGDRVNINMNMYLLSLEKVLEIIERAEKEQNYKELDALVKDYMLDYNLNVYEYTGYAANVESINQFYYANMDMLERPKFNSLFASSQPILTKTKHGVPTYYAKDSVVKKSIIATGVKIDGHVENSIINRKVHVAKDAQVRNAIIFQETKIGEGAIIDYAIIDKECIIKPGAQIIGTPDEIKVVAKYSIVE